MDQSQHQLNQAPWINHSATTAPAILGASVGMLIADLLHPNARKAMGITLGIIGVLAIAPKAFGGVKSLVTGPRSKVGVRRRIQSIRDAGVSYDTENEDVDSILKEQGLL